MSGRKRRYSAPSKTPWDSLGDGFLTPAQALVRASHEGAYGFRHEPFAGDIAFLNQFQRDSCPWCGSDDVNRRGHCASGLQRYLCNSCNKSFTPASGTIFDSRRLPLPAWVDFLLQLFSFESINAMTREDRRSETTVPYWVGKVFSVLEGIQDDMVLSGRVQIDEAFYPVPGKEAVTVDGRHLRGLSRNKICIAIGCDGLGRSYFTRAGYGKPSSGRAMEAYGPHIRPGSLLVHDMEKAHCRLVAALGLTEEVYNSRLISRLDDAENPLGDVNRLCYLVKRFLNSHSGFDRDGLDGYLDLFSVMMNPPANKMEKAALVLNSAMLNPKTLRYREFYNVKPSSGG